jgi:hypothetical protein
VDVGVVQHLAAWVHWRRAHRRPQAKERYERYDALRSTITAIPRTQDLSYTDIQWQRCHELDGRLRIPRR